MTQLTVDRVAVSLSARIRAPSRASAIPRRWIRAQTTAVTRARAITCRAAMSAPASSGEGTPGVAPIA